MIDVNLEAEKALVQTGYTVVYSYPDNFNDLPVISFYTLTESGSFACDNSEAIQEGCVQVDIWADEPQDCGDIALKVNEVMNANGWVREMSRDVPNPDSRVIHKTARFSKEILL